MSLQPIPEDWRTRVAAILRQGNRRHIKHTSDCLQRFEATFLDAFPNELHEALADALSREVREGCPVVMDPPPAGTTWEFFFHFRGRRLYGKALLTKDRNTVCLFSAHPPDKPRLRCE